MRDEGSGIAELEAINDGRYVSRTGMGLGIAGSRRLVDRFEIETGPEGTSVLLAHELPAGRAAGGPELAHIAEELARTRPNEPLEELTAQNQELLRALDELRERASASSWR